jgi:cell wall-associated NlpC family hydrolase
LLGGLHLNIRAWLAVATIVLIALTGWMLFAGPRLATGGTASTGGEARHAQLPPLPWQDDPGSRPPAPPKASNVTEQPEPRSAPAPVDPATGMPAASAGTNGSFTPPPPGERKRIAVATHPPEGPNASERTALLLNNTALAPPAAPDQVKAAISAANLIVGQPYKLGGGHASWRSAGYDCSGAVSYALAGAGLINAPLSSGQLMSWGVPGPGRWLTVYANSGHAYAVIAGLRWDTVGDARGSGPRWHPFDAYPRGFAARHFPGL